LADNVPATRTRRSRRLRFEPLEDRRLLTSGTLAINEFGLPAPTSGPLSSGVNNIASAPDGTLWFTEQTQLVAGIPQPSKIGKITTDGIATEYLIKNNDGVTNTSSAFPGGITVAPDGVVWFTEGSGQIVKFDPANGKFTSFAIPGGGSPTALTYVSDQGLFNTAIYFTDQRNNAIGKIAIDGTITEYTIEPNLDPYTLRPFGIAEGPDGNIWFTEQTGNKIGRMTPSGVMSSPFFIQHSNAQPEGIAVGPDGNLWFTEENSQQIGRITPAGKDASGAVTIKEYTLFSGIDLPTGITTGADHNLWFTEASGNRIGQLDPSTGAVNEFDLPTASQNPAGIASGADGNIWFTESHYTPDPMNPFNGAYNGHIGQAIIPSNTNPAVDVEITSDSPSPVKPGEPVTIHLTVKNKDTQHPVSFTVYDPIPEGVGFSADEGDYFQTDTGTADVTKGLGTVHIDNLETFGTAHITLRVTAVGAGQIVNRAYAVSNAPDPVAGNNVAVTSVTVQPLSADVVIGGLLVGDATGDPLTFNTSTNTGSTGKFSWTLTRTGGDTADNLMATITLPPQLKANSVVPFTDSPGTFDYTDGQHITFRMHSLPYTDPDHPQNDPNTVHFGFTAQPTALGDISVTASVTANEELNGSPDPLTKTVTTTVIAPTTTFSLSSSLDASPNPLKFFENTHVGTTANYTWNLVDTGTTEASNVVVSMTIPATLKNINAYPPNVFSATPNADGSTSLTFAWPSMSHGDNEIFGFTADAAAVGDASVTATVTASPSIRGTVATTINTSVVAATTQLTFTEAHLIGDSSGTPMLFDTNTNTGATGKFGFNLKQTGGDAPTHLVATLVVPRELTDIQPFLGAAPGSFGQSKNGDGSTSITFSWNSLPSFFGLRDTGLFGFTAEPTKIGGIIVSASATADQKVLAPLPLTSVFTVVENTSTALTLTGNYVGDLMTIDASNGTGSSGTFSWTVTNAGGHAATNIHGTIPIPTSLLENPTDLTIDTGGFIFFDASNGNVDFDFTGALAVHKSLTLSFATKPKALGPVSLTASVSIDQPLVGGGSKKLATVETIVLSSDHFHLYNPDPALGKNAPQGPVIPNAHVVPIYYGHQWDTDPTVIGFPQIMQNAMASMVNGPYMDFLSYYSTHSQKIGRGSIEDALYVDDTEPGALGGNAPAVLNDWGNNPAIKKVVTNQIDAYLKNTKELPDPVDTLYVIYTPPGTVVKDSSSESSANKFLGYHSTVDYQTGGLFGLFATTHTYNYILMPYQDTPNSKLGKLKPFDSASVVFSHELAEAVTDPDVSSGWRDYPQDTQLQGLTEIGDLAANRNHQVEEIEGGTGDYGMLDGYPVQYEWANIYTYPGTDLTVENQPVLPRDGTSKTLQIKKVVDPVKKTITGSSGEPPTYSFSGLIASFDDTSNTANDPAIYTPTIDWGDGTTSTGTVAYDPNLKQFLISGAHDYATAVAGSTATISISLIDNANGDISSFTADVTLQETSADAATIQFDQPTFDAYRNGSSAVITVDRVGDATLGATVDFHVSGGTAVDGTDYQGLPGTLTFAPGATSATILLPVYSNPDATGNLTVNLVLSTPTGNAVLGTQTTTLVTIHSSDQVFTPPAPLLDVHSDTGALLDDGTTANNGSAAAPLVFNVSGASVRNGYLQLVDVTDPDNPIDLGEPVQAVNGAATITLDDDALADGTHLIAVINSTLAASGARRASLATQITIDSVTPSSALSGVPAFTSLTKFPVNWSGADNGLVSGLRGFNISVSVDGADAVPWLSNTTLTSSTFPATLGHSYAFFSAAVDVAGNTEPTHAVADASVSVTDTPWHNPHAGRGPDVTDDGHIVAEDVVTIINYINAHGSGPLPASVLTTNPPKFVDTDSDDNVAASDVITVINFINAHPGLNEGEAADFSSDTAIQLPESAAGQTEVSNDDSLLLLIAADVATQMTSGRGNRS
jgi:streptogramin lyase